MNRTFSFFIFCFVSLPTFAQTNIVTYAGNNGKECLYDVIQQPLNPRYVQIFALFELRILFFLPL